MLLHREIARSRGGRPRKAAFCDTSREDAGGG
jgi:hypothetical protein